MLHRFAKLVAVCTGCLILAGSLVTSNGAGLSVPDWPTSYGWNMFTFPPSMWVGNILYEHGHRLIASTVGFLTIVLAVWLWRTESRRWMRWLGVTALAAVIAQGLLGGITVLFFLPAAISTAHAGLAEIFFSITVAIALFTSSGWIRGYAIRGPSPVDRAFEVGPKGPALPTEDPPGVDDGTLRKIATITTVAIYIQILLGATMRHTEAGLAIPDFPLMFGHLIPPQWDAKIAIHFAHRVGALVATVLILATSAHTWYHHPRRRELARPASLIVGLVLIQITLGALTVLSRRDVWINSAHVVGGALVLTTSLVITLRSWRVRFVDAAVAARETRVQADGPKATRPVVAAPTHGSSATVPRGARA